MAAVNDDPASLDGAKPGTRAIVRVLAFAAVAAMTSFVVGWLVGDGSFRHWLFSCAGSLEFWGVLLGGIGESRFVPANSGVLRVRKAGFYPSQRQGNHA